MLKIMQQDVTDYIYACTQLRFIAAASVQARRQKTVNPGTVCLVS